MSSITLSSGVNVMDLPGSVPSGDVGISPNSGDTGVFVVASNAEYYTSVDSGSNWVLGGNVGSSGTFVAFSGSINRIYVKSKSDSTVTNGLRAFQRVQGDISLPVAGVAYTTIESLSDVPDYAIADAGKYGSVTIATNMAGRGTDIQLGGSNGSEEEKDKSLNSGGLFVIGTERHESRRVDNQLRGRSGRQGDPGKSKFYLSLDDDLMRIFGSDRLDMVLKKLGLEEGESIVHPWINTALERAQKKVESRNFEIRKTLLKFDNVMNDQRKVIFEQRLDLLQKSDVSETIYEMRHDLILDIIQENIPEKSFIDDWDIETIQKELKRIFNDSSPIEEWIKDPEIDEEILEKKLNDFFDIKYEEKVENFGKEITPSLEKSILMQVIDQNWTDHLSQLEDLRQIVGIRGYGQRDPLNEYKSESFLLFETLLNKFREDTTRTLFHIKMVSQEAIKKLEENSNESIDRNHPQLKEKRINTEFDRNDPKTWGKIGRNEKCPCGSGKKYKNCHGRLA